MAKSAAERMRAMRARNKANGLKQLRLYAPPELHDEIRNFATVLIEQSANEAN
jgi:hypothetical protein